jgi:hypothetical protein
MNYLKIADKIALEAVGLLQDHCGPVDYAICYSEKDQTIGDLDGEPPCRDWGEIYHRFRGWAHSQLKKQGRVILYAGRDNALVSVEKDAFNEYWDYQETSYNPELEPYLRIAYD